MNWKDLYPAPSGTHHLRAGEAAYDARFDAVLKFHAPGLAPVSRAGRAWHIHPDGSRAYAQRHHRCFGFYEDRAAVQASDGWFHILPDGSPLYPERYDWCGNYQCRCCTVRTEKGAYFHLDLHGRPLYESRWRYAGDYRDGIAVVQGNDGRSTHIDPRGEVLHGSWFLDLDVFHKRHARARDDEGWMHVDERGRPLYARRFAAVEPFYNGQARVELLDGSLEVIDESASTLLVLRQASSLSEGTP